MEARAVGFRPVPGCSRGQRRTPSRTRASLLKARDVLVTTDGTGAASHAGNIVVKGSGVRIYRLDIVDVTSIAASRTTSCTPRTASRAATDVRRHEAPLGGPGPGAVKSDAITMVVERRGRAGRVISTLPALRRVERSPPDNERSRAHALFHRDEPEGWQRPYWEQPRVLGHETVGSVRGTWLTLSLATPRLLRSTRGLGRCHVVPRFLAVRGQPA